jgi:hypothetical protein
VPPFDFRLTLDQFTETLAAYQGEAGDRFDFSPVDEDLNALRRALDDFYTHVDTLETSDLADPAARRASLIQRRLARVLIPVNYARQGRFWQDPAQNIPPLPDLAFASQLASAVEDSHEARAATISLQRGLNRLRWSLRQAREIVQGGGVPEE